MGLTISWYALSSFFPSSDNLPPYLTMSSWTYCSRSPTLVIPLSNSVCRMIS